MYQFSSGSLYGIGNGPRKFGALQDVAVDISFTKKALYGQNQFALTIARGQGKITGKAKFATLNALMLQDLFFNTPVTSTQTITPIFGEAGTVGSSPFNVTVANGATFVDDLGVFDGVTGLPYQRVGTPSVTGQYSVNLTTGVYTFFSGDVGKAVFIDYTFKSSTAAGLQLALSQQLSGTTPSFGIILATKYNGKALYLNLVACVSDKLSLATKMDDFMVPEFDFEAMANAAGSVGNLTLAE